MAAPRITPERFRERARAWLIRYTGWVSPGRDEALASELQRAYDEGHEAGATKTTNADE
jgi:hypothetical protein